MRVMRYGSFLAAALAMAPGLALMGTPIPLLPSRVGVPLPKPVRQRRSNPYPDLNRAKRHPPARSYREAAVISTGLGVRTGPLR